MKLNVKLKTLLIAVLTVVAFAMAIPGFATLANTSNEYQFVFSGEFKEFYQVGDELSVPSATVTNGANSYQASCSVVMPNKTATKNSTISLTDAGNYIVEYSAYIADEQRYMTKSFDIVVNNSLYSVVGEGSVDYVNYNDNIKGVVATLYNGDTFTFNNYVDLKEMKGAALFKMFPYPQIIGEADVNKLIVKITDVYDEGKFITVRIKKSDQKSEGVDWSWYVTYVDANYTDDSVQSDFIGMKYNEKGTYVCNGQKYSLFRNNEAFGTETGFSLAGGVKGNQSIKNAAYALGYDYEKNQLHSYVVSNSSANKQLISDFSNVNIFPQLFEGFTDGKVKISITPEGFNKSSCKFIFTEFAGKPIIEDGYNTFVYNKAPQLDIDFGDFTEETVPNGLPNVKYDVFKATAFDYIDGNINVETNVYFGYSNTKKVKIDVVDDKFTPKYSGLYTIEYKAKNSFGNSSIKTVDILITPKSVPFSFDVEDFNTAGMVGQELVLLSGYNAQNYYGNTDLKAIVELSTDSSVKFELSSENNFTFKPIYAGTYNVKLICNDYVESASLDKTIEISSANVVLYSVDGYFPHYLIKNGTYELPTVISTNLSSGVPQKTPTELYVVKSDNTEEKQSGKLLVTSDEFIKLSYRPTGLDWANPYEITLPIVNTGLGTSKIYKQDYFATVNGEFVKGATTEDVYFEVQEFEDGQATLEFVNVLQGHNFFISLAPFIKESGYKQVEEISFILSDVSNDNRFIKLTMMVKDDGVYITVNDNKETKIANSWGDIKDVMTISYDTLNSLIKINSSFDVTVENFFGLNDIASFDKGMLAKIIVKGSEVGCGVRISAINNQLLTSSTRDRTAPIIDDSMNNNKGEYNLNDIVTFKPYKVYDVLSPTVNFSFYIKKPNGEYARDLNGVLLDGSQDAKETYLLKLDSYGDYEVYPVAVDSINENSNNNTGYKMTVVNRILPVITLDNHLTSAKLGKALVIANYTVDKQNCITFVSVLNSKGIQEFVSGNVFVPKYKGNHVVTITAIDENGNMAHASYVVTVV